MQIFTAPTDWPLSHIISCCIILFSLLPDAAGNSPFNLDFSSPSRNFRILAGANKPKFIWSFCSFVAFIVVEAAVSAVVCCTAPLTTASNFSWDKHPAVPAVFVLVLPFWCCFCFRFGSCSCCPCGDVGGGGGTFVLFCVCKIWKRVCLKKN